MPILHHPLPPCLILCALLVSCAPSDSRPASPGMLGDVVSGGDVAISRPTDSVTCPAAEILLLDRNMSVVSGRIHVVPIGDHRVAIRAVSFGRDGEVVTNEFVLKHTGQVEEVPDALRPEIDRAVAAPCRCKIHGQPLVEGPTLMLPVSGWPQGYLEARKTLFPNAHSSSRSDIAPETNAVVARARGRFCSGCRAAEKTWLEEHRK
jgi:hypothetical protein